ncbi:hypothetical protein MNEG_9279 [Monoraphidium neglectum]|uniref:Uncharacterized protein n=1 Tax=Monoraphidium neglectum TaxID=145388 RepID=A0A0D2MWU5_9CHLO|nr:hypothetical protein MNEG_9279 [Monoraphidium neglectum]KIY98685.1 hypothetical protein MNEG_9279 [Monoraphidium neglectum]|eukprot:XP_013897705.1 hypothetical protein MNEG_9279 [Monoraphidium neglectum]
MRASLLLCSCLAVLAALVAADGADYSVDYSSRSLLGASGCAQDAAAKAVTTLQKTVDKFGTDLNRVGAVVDEARAAYTDPSGYIRNAIIRSNPAVMITQALARELDVKNICDTDERKAAFSAGGWRGYYGKRLWDSRSVALLVGSVIPATSAAAVSEILSEMKSQYSTAMSLLDKAVEDANVHGHPLKRK